MKQENIASVVDDLKKAKTKTERATILRDNDCPALRGLLRMNFDITLVLALPEGAPPYKKNKSPFGFTKTTLRASVRGWKFFVKELSPELKQHKREHMFIGLLEGLNEKEASVLLDAKDRKLDLGVTRKLIDEVFPNLIKSEAKTNVKKESSPKSTDTGNSQSS